MTLIARSVAIEVVDGILTIGLAEHEDTSGWALVFMEPGETSDEEQVLGMDTHCISDHPGRSVYGAIREWVYGNGSLVLTLNDEATRVLGLPADLIIELMMDPHLAEELRMNLRRVLRDVPSVS